jgi:sialate O-acetylesterase
MLRYIHIPQNIVLVPIKPLAALLLAALAMGCLAPHRAVADVRLPHLISDHMIFQRDKPIRVWGWAAEGEHVRVHLAGKSAETSADHAGKWQVELAAMPAGGPHELVVEGKNRLVVRDVLVGEVWFASGQSNMEWILFKAIGGDAAIREADYPQIRLFTVPQLLAKQPQEDMVADWRPCSPKTVSWFSAVAFFFGRELHRELKVPVGLVASAYGGTRIEDWTPGIGVSAVEELRGKDRAENGGLYNGMVHAITPLRVRGAIWYQGEGNVGDGMTYLYRMKALIGGWRAVWGEGDFPFYYVQVAPLNWGGKPKDQLPQLWEAQTAAMQVPHTGMAITNDIGNVGDAHPRNKRDVGKRLALWALAKTYGRKDLICCGPLYQSMQVEGNKIRIKFSGAEDGLESRRGKPLTWFTIAGSDRKFVPAQAEIDGKTIVVSSETVTAPVAVRFAWHQVAEPNLMNKAGLPASAFRTDTW